MAAPAGKPKGGLSNIRPGKPKPPDRTKVLATLTGLHATLKTAVEQHDHGKATLTRHDIDEQLEELHKCADPAGIADPSEWGSQGVGPT